MWYLLTFVLGALVVLGVWVFSSVGGATDDDDVNAPPWRLAMKIGRVAFIDETKGEPCMRVTLTTEQFVTVGIRPVTATGRPAVVDGIPQWTQSEPGAVKLQPAADGMTCRIIATSKPGLRGVLVTADADLGAGMRQISADIDVEVIPAEAVGFGILVGEIEAQVEIEEEDVDVPPNPPHQPPVVTEPLPADVPPATGHPIGEGQE